jgi:hypothetical protein
MTALWFKELNKAATANDRKRLSGQTTTLKIDKCLGQLSGRFWFRIIFNN